MSVGVGYVKIKFVWKIIINNFMISYWNSNLLKDGLKMDGEQENSSFEVLFQNRYLLSKIEVELPSLYYKQINSNQTKIRRFSIVILYISS